MSTSTASPSSSSQPLSTRGRPAHHEESTPNPLHETLSDSLGPLVNVTHSLDATHAEIGPSESAPRRSTRGKAHAPPEPAPLPVRHQVPRKQHVEFLRAPPDIVAAFREARTEYHDAIYAWWYSRPRAREDKATPEDCALVKLDPRVKRTGRRLDELDAELTRRGIVVKTSTFTNNSGWALNRKIRDEEHKLNREHWAAEHALESSSTGQDARPGKRKRAAATCSSESASASTSRASTHDTATTTPEPDRVEKKKEGVPEPARFARKKARVV
ncbi:hypothetical protein AURDEDRAFT_167887 [Auricularia subglabra TFB-10046 SS5]|nr:hypothetical protein AURDEDRAFT_167887 [Auricularia subglabra TFB-10046 SS5]